MRSWEQVLVGPTAALREALIKIDVAGTQVALVVDAQRRLLGTLSDGDIRRGLINGLELSAPVERAMHTTPTTVRDNTPRETILALMRRLGLHQVPILNADNVVIGLLTVDDFLNPAARENWVVVMVGGLGTRLSELTRETPTPMLRVGDRPILETILQTFAEQGFRRFYLAVNFKAEVIENYFGDGSRFGIDIRYLRESKRMGTAGSLSLFPERPSAPFFVTNGDLLVKLDFAEMLDAHLQARAAATMAVRDYEFQIPYGVVHEAEGGIERVDEKPVHRSLVSAGIYVLSPSVLDLVPRDSFVDMPSVFAEVVARRMGARCFRVRDYWMDVGRLADYEKANSDYPEIFR